jgi:voltage-gated potassium channel Kch
MSENSPTEMQSGCLCALSRYGAWLFTILMVGVFSFGFWVMKAPETWDFRKDADTPLANSQVEVLERNQANVPPLFPDIFFHTLRLFTANLPDSNLREPLRPTLLCAATLAIVFTIATVLQLVASSVTRVIIFFYRLRYRRHVIICGLSRKAHHLAVAYKKCGRRVVLIEKDSTHPGVDALLDMGVRLEFGDATDPRVLKNARIQRASLIVGLAGQEANARIQHANANLAKEKACKYLPARFRRKRVPVPAILHVEDRHLYKALQWHEFIQRSNSTGDRVRFFNLADWGAESLIDREVIPPKTPHYLIVGAGGLGQALVVGLTRKWMRTGNPGPDDRITFTLVDRDAEEQRDLLLCGFPSLMPKCNLVPCPLEIRSAAFSSGRFLKGSDLPSISKVFVCLGDDGLSLLASLEIQRMLPRLAEKQENQHVLECRDTCVEIIARVAEDEGLLWADHLTKQGASRLCALKPYRILEEVMTSNIEHSRTTEQLAITLHNAYRNVMAEIHLKDEGRFPGPAEVPWEQLDEVYQESSRAQAASIEVALAELDRPRTVVVQQPGRSTRLVAPLSHEEIEILAGREHERWMAERLALGWTYGIARDNSKKLHPNLLPWSQLDEDTKKIDIQMVNAWTEALRDAKMELRAKGDSLMPREMCREPASKRPLE